MRRLQQQIKRKISETPAPVPAASSRPASAVSSIKDKIVQMMNSTSRSNKYQEIQQQSPAQTPTGSSAPLQLGESPEKDNSLVMAGETV